MKKSLFFSCLFICNCLYGQNIQWGYEVIEYSSQYMSTKYSAEQALGPANVYTQGGDNKLAWSPKDDDGKLEFIKVGFETPMKAIQIAVICYNLQQL